MINSGDTAWILVSTSLVMLMVPGLAFFYSGMVRDKNVVATMMHIYMKLAVISVIWILWGYSLAFGDSILHGFIGGFDYIGLNNISEQNTTASGTNIPHILFVIFQGMFAVVTVAIITGSFAERVKLGPILIFAIMWVTIVYAPIAHWIWGGGWISNMVETLDFAGGSVVHINSAIAGLVAAIYIGKRNGLDNNNDANNPHNISLTVIGASLLWFGWFGFNAGSALAADNIASIALINTNAAAAAGAIGWFIVELCLKDKSTIIGIISGSIAGLVAITPAAGFVSPLHALLIGFSSSILCYYAVIYIKPKFKYDDSLDVFGIHGIGGIWGAIATGIFASTEINSNAIDGLLYGNSKLFIGQIISTIIIISYSAIMTLIILKIINIFVKIRVSKIEEFDGLDMSQHGEKCYNIK